MKSTFATFYRFGAQRSAWVLIVTLCVLLVWFIWHDSVDIRSNAQATQSQAQDWLRTTALLQQEQLEQAPVMLQVLSGISLSRPRETATCNTFLARQLERFPRYRNLIFADTQGAVWCYAKTLSGPLALPVMTAQNKPLLLALSDQQLGFALPQFSTDGYWLGAIIAVLSVQDFFPTKQNTLPANSIIGIANAQGNLLLTYPALSIDAQNAIANTQGFWQVSQELSGSAEPLQLLLHLPTPQTVPTPYWPLLFLLVLTAVVLWRSTHRQKVQAFTRYAREKLHRLVSQRAAQIPSNTQILRGAYAELKGAFIQKETRVQQLLQLDELNQRLQTCGSTSEWADTVARCAQAIFPNCHGALYLRVDEGHYGLSLAWGGSPLMQSLKPQDCHALHSKRAYVSHGAKDSACAHAHSAEHYVCIPLCTVNDSLGLLYLSFFYVPNVQSTPPWAATAIADRAAFGLMILRRLEQLHLRAIRDTLTGLFNRGFMEEALAIEQQQALRRNACIGIMMLDVDYFKRYNDNYGHATGDSLLREIGKLIQQTVREGDIPCRYGGEEFLVILPGADLASTHQRAEVLRLAIERWHPTSAHQSLATVTVSIGVAVFPVHGTIWQAVVKSADQALYAAKHAGRNRVAVATPKLEAPATV